MTALTCPKHQTPETDAEGYAIPRDCRACDRLTALAELRALCPPGTTVYTILRSVSRSGMSRTMDVYVMRGGEPYRITFRVASLIGCRMARNNEGLIRGGCGMDMGFDTVYCLSRALWQGQFTCTGENGEGGKWCPSNDHSNGDRNYNPHPHTDGGYALNHRWL